MSEDTSRIKAMIEKAIVDGVLSRAESEIIKSEMRADKKVTKEEVKLWNDLQRMVNEGEIRIN